MFSKFVLSRAREGSTTSNLLTNSAYINQVLTGNYCRVSFLITIREYSETEITLSVLTIKVLIRMHFFKELLIGAKKEERAELLELLN